MFRLCKFFIHTFIYSLIKKEALCVQVHKHLIVLDFLFNLSPWDLFFYYCEIDFVIFYVGSMIDLITILG